MSALPSPTKTIDYSYFISAHSSRRRAALTRELTRKEVESPHEFCSLAEGLPNELTFPFEMINVALKDGTGFTLQGPQLNAAFQYLPTQGYPALVKSLKEFTFQSHRPPQWKNCELLVTNGSQDGISKSLEMVLEEGAPLLVQDPLYSGTEIVLKPFKPDLIGIEQDQYGIIPKKITEALERCKAKYTEGGGKMPKALYVNPTGSNPTGVTIPLERRKEIYEICCKYNLLIIEDDAYFFLHFLDEQPKSFLSIDTEGRVIRLDSISKVLSSGLRMGWLTGPKQLVQNIELHIQSAVLHPSSVSQILLHSLIQSWGFDGLHAHFASVRAFYKARRDYTLASMERHLKGLADWTVPSGGMFLWVRVRGIADTYEMIMTRAFKKYVTFVPGHAFLADPTKACNCIRLSFSRATPKQIDKGLKILADLIRDEQLLLRRKMDNLDLDNNILR